MNYKLQIYFSFGSHICGIIGRTVQQISLGKYKINRFVELFKKKLFEESVFPGYQD